MKIFEPVVNMIFPSTKNEPIIKKQIDDARNATPRERESCAAIVEREADDAAINGWGETAAILHNVASKIRSGV